MRTDLHSDDVAPTRTDLHSIAAARAAIRFCAIVGAHRFALAPAAADLHVAPRGELGLRRRRL